jgi:uncharacterized protein YbbK (DUF523 family)
MEPELTDFVKMVTQVLLDRTCPGCGAKLVFEYSPNGEDWDAECPKCHACYGGSG